MLLTEGLYDTSNFRESEQALFDKMMFEAVAPIRKAARHDIEEALVTVPKPSRKSFPTRRGRPATPSISVLGTRP